MQVFITDTDRQSAKRIALKNLSRFFNVEDWDSKTNAELYADLLKNKQAKSINPLLTEYFKAVDEWYGWYVTNGKITAGRKLTDKENKEFRRVIENKEVALCALQQKFDAMQLDKLKIAYKVKKGTLEIKI